MFWQTEDLKKHIDFEFLRFLSLLQLMHTKHGIITHNQLHTLLSLVKRSRRNNIQIDHIHDCVCVGVFECGIRTFELIGTKRQQDGSLYMSLPQTKSSLCYFRAALRWNVRAIFKSTARHRHGAAQKMATCLQSRSIRREESGINICVMYFAQWEVG